MIANKTLRVTECGVRLDAALVSAFPDTTRALVREAIERGTVLVNGRHAAKGFKLRGGENVAVVSLAEVCDNVVAPNPSLPLHVIHEDSCLLGLDKPAGMPVQPLAHTETETLMNAVVARYPECAALGDRPLMAGALHRIDAGTSGLVIVARTARAFDTVRAQFSAQTVEKTYLALVEGTVVAGGTLENDLVHDPTVPFCRMIDAHHNRLTRDQCDGLRILPARTRFEPVAHSTVESEERTLLKVTIFTGVTHQIRAQLALAGMHIINDRLYGAFAVENQRGHCLHALSARFRHPATDETVTLSTQPPAWA